MSYSSPLPNARLSAPSAAAAMDTNAHAKGSYRNDLSYTAALKSEGAGAHKAQGSYRYDIAYTAALKSDSTAANKNTADVSGLKFSGATSLVAPVLFSAPLISTFAKLDQSTSMFSIASRDAIDSSGRVYQEFKRNKHGGRESLFEEFATTVVWGGGIPASKMLYDRIVSRLAQSGSKPEIHFPDIDMTLLPKSKSTKSDKLFDRIVNRVFKIDNTPVNEQLTPEAVDKYFKNVQDLPDHVYQAQKKQLKSLLQNDDAARAMINKYRGNQFAKLLLCTFLPVLAIGFGIPKVNQWITRRKIQEEKATLGAHPSAEMERLKHSTHAQSHQDQSVRNAFHPNDVLRMAAQPVKNADKAQPANIQFGNAGQRLSDVMGGFLANDTVTSVVFVDGPLSSGRVITARNKDERIERAFREACIITTLFFIQTPLQKFISNCFDKGFGSFSGVDLRLLQRLNQDAVKSGKTAEQQFLSEYQALREQLGNPAKLANHTENTSKMVEGIREYFSKPITKSNMLYDLAEVSGKIPTLAVKNNPKMPKYINITQQIDDEGVHTVARYLDMLAEKLSTKPGALQKSLVKTAGAKILAFMLSAAACWSIVSLFVPKTQHAITKRRTGQDQFPGIEGLA